MDFKENAEKIWLENEEGKMIACVDFPEKDGIADLVHTEVDPSLRGQGVAGKLMEALIAKMEKESRKLVLTCPYAVDWFNKNRGHENVLADAKREYEKAVNKG